MPRRVPATKVEPRDGLRPIRSELPPEVRTPDIPEHDYSPPLHHRLSAAIGLIGKGRIVGAIGVVIGTSDMTVEDSEAGPLATMGRIRAWIGRLVKNVRHWQTTIIGFLTSISTILALLLGDNTGEVINVIGLVGGAIVGIVLMFIRPAKPEEEPTP